MKRTRSKSKKLKIETRKKDYPFDFKKYLTLRNILIFIILIVLYLLFPKYVQPIVLIIVFYPISLLSTKTTKFIKHLNTETITPFTIFLGYLYGWKWAFFFGFILGTYMWSQTALNQLTMVQCVLNGFAAFCGYWASIWFPGNFVIGYIVAVTLRNVISFLIFLIFNPSLVENITHTVSAIMTNTILMPFFLNILYKIVMFLSPT